MNTKNKISISKRYANSLLELAKSQNDGISSFRRDFLNVKEILENSPELMGVLINPSVNINSKKEIIERVFANDTNIEIRNFLKLIIEKGRFNFINSIIEELFSLLDIYENILHVEIKSAVELNDEQKQSLEKKLNQKLNKKPFVKYSIDNSIVAGLVCKIDDNVIDTSISYKLEKFKKELIKK